MSTWRLLGEIPQGRTREEIRAQSLGGWNPWQYPWHRYIEPDIVIADPEHSSRARHVHTYWVEHNGNEMKFAAELLDSDMWRFYIPAPPGEDGAFETRPARVAGYWRFSQNDDDDLPWPVPDPTWTHRSAFLDLLARAEADARRIAYRGFSLCRLCGCMNGNQGLRLDDMEWPEGFRHYIVDHQVRPDFDFEAFITRWTQTP